MISERLERLGILLSAVLMAGFLGFSYGLTRGKRSEWGTLGVYNRSDGALIGHCPIKIEAPGQSFQCVTNSEVIVLQ